MKDNVWQRVSGLSLIIALKDEIQVIDCFCTIILENIALLNFPIRPYQQ